MKQKHKELLRDIIDGVIRADEARPEIVRNISKRTDLQLRNAILDSIDSRINQMNTGNYRGDDLCKLRSQLLENRDWAFISPDEINAKIALVDKKIQQRKDAEEDRRETIQFLSSISDELRMIITLEKL